MSKARTEEILISEYVELSKKTSSALLGLEKAIKDLNDNNVLHSRVLEQNTQALVDIKSYWGKIVLILVVVISSLAGVEKVIKLLGL